MGEQVKVYFQLEQDEDGYPPVAVESVWAQPSKSVGEYVLDNIPFFARDATIGDTVCAQEKNGNLWFQATIARSKNSLVRVVFFDRNAVKEVSGRLEKLGCEVEYLRDHNLLAVNIPESVPLVEVQTYLQDEAAAGRLDYEEPILRQ